MAGGNRCVGGEDAAAGEHARRRMVRRGTQRTATQFALKQRQGEQSRVALVHVVDVDLQPESVGHADAAHAEHDLLLEAVVRVAAVEVVGKAAIPAGVFFDVGIEQIDGNDVAGAAFEVVAPGAHGNGAVFNGDGNAGRLLAAVVGWIPGLNLLGLRAGGVKMLLEVALAMQQS